MNMKHMIPQIIYLSLIAISLMLGSFLHGKKRDGKYNVFTSIFVTSIGVALLYWGGFFDPMFN